MFREVDVSVFMFVQRNIYQRLILTNSSKTHYRTETFQTFFLYNGVLGFIYVRTSKANAARTLCTEQTKSPAPHKRDLTLIKYTPLSASEPRFIRVQ